MPTTNNVSSRQLMEEVITRAAMAFVQSMKATNGNNDNLVLREIKSLHSNTTYEDLPEHLQALVKEIATAMFGYINHQGFVLVPKER